MSAGPAGGGKARDGACRARGAGGPSRRDPLPEGRPEAAAAFGLGAGCGAALKIAVSFRAAATRSVKPWPCFGPLPWRFRCGSVGFFRRWAACPGAWRDVAPLPSACTPGRAGFAELPHEGTKPLRGRSDPPSLFGGVVVAYARARCRCPVDWGAWP